MTTADALQTRLQLREGTSDSEWQVWEHKTFNIHRGVLYWRPPDPNLSYAEMTASVRERVRANYHVSWWRGFGFGVVIDAKAVPPDISDIEATVDTRGSRKGTWQWTVFSCEPAAMGVGIHTWAEGYLSPVYRQLLARFESFGWAVGNFKKEKDRLGVRQVKNYPRFGRSKPGKARWRGNLLLPNALMQFLTAAALINGQRLREFEP